MNDAWIDHERALAGLMPRGEGKCFTGVTVTFRATHEDPKRIKPPHGHEWRVTAWFPAGSDARDAIAPVRAIADTLDGAHIPTLWGEGIAATFGRRLEGCVGVDVERDDEPFKARWDRNA